MRTENRKGAVARFTAVALALTLLSACFSACGGGDRGRAGGALSVDQVKIQARQLGEGWVLEDEVEVDLRKGDPGSNLDPLKEAGAQLVLNQHFRRGERYLQVNYVQTPGDAEAEAVLEIITRKGSGNLYGRLGNIAVEIIGGEEESNRKAGLALGLELSAADSGDDGTVSVYFNLACVDSIDYQAANQLSVYLENYRTGDPVDPAVQKIIEGTTFGDSVKLLVGRGDGPPSEYGFNPPDAGRRETGCGVVDFSFDAGSLPSKAGVPYVEVKAVVKPRITDIDTGDKTVLTDAEKSANLESTGYWPTGDQEVRRALSEAVQSGQSDLQKVRAIWKWVRDNIEYKGPPGTRYGTVQVLKQKYGRCWDRADVFTTMSRAAGVPSREVAGWLRLNTPEGEGHVWNQAYIEGKGWIDVDTTGSSIGADFSYIPYFATSDGATPILYTQWPTLED